MPSQASSTGCYAMATTVDALGVSEVGRHKSRMPPQERGIPSLLSSLINYMAFAVYILYAPVVCVCACACLDTPQIAQLSEPAGIRAKPQTYSSSAVLPAGCNTYG